MTSQITVRSGIPEDRQWVIGTAAKLMLTEEFGRPEYYNEKDCGSLFDLGVNTGVVLIAENDSGPVGCITGLYVPNPFNSQRTILQEVFWYVLKEHRNGRAGLLLLNKFCEIGKSTAHDVFMSLLDTSEVSDRMMARKGFVRRETGYAMKGI